MDETQLVELTIDVRKLEDLIWERSILTPGCPVCDMDHDDICRLHNDAINLGHKSGEFLDRWRDVVEPMKVDAHLQHHFVPSKLVTKIRQVKRSYDAARGELELDEYDPDSLAVSRAAAGDFGVLYGRTMQTLVAHQRKIQEYAEREIRNRRNVEDWFAEDDSDEARKKIDAAVAREAKAVKQSFQMLGELNGHVMGIDKRYHDKTFQAIRMFMEQIRFQLLGETVDAIKRNLMGMKIRLGSFMSEGDVNDIVGTVMGSIKSELAIIADAYLEDSERRVKAIGGGR